MRRTVRLLAGYLRRYYLEWMGGRGFLVTLVANQAVTPLIGLAVWSTALGGGAGISSYYVALLTVRLLSASYENHTFSGRIYDGSLAEDLLRPHGVVLAPLAYNLAMRVWHALLGLPLLVGAALLFGASFDLAEVGIALPALVLAGGLRFLFTYTLALSAFWTERAHGVVGFGDVLIFLLGGEAAPLPLMPEALRPWAEALPFRAMLGFPAEVASGVLSTGQIIAGYVWQLAWGMALVFLAALVWQRGVRRYTAVGG
jgi:ABC-2 type transport system permease protein